MSDETPAEPRVVWTYEADSGTLYRAVYPGGKDPYVCDIASDRCSMRNPIWSPFIHEENAYHQMFLALLADYLTLKVAAPPPNIPAPPSALSAFVAENPGFGTLELMDRRPPTARTHQELHAALCKDPQISWQDAGTIERTRGWYAVYGKPEAKAAEQTADDVLLDLVREHPDCLTGKLYRLARLDGESFEKFCERVRAHPGLREVINRGVSVWRLAEPEPDPEFVGPTLEELVRDKSGKTTRQLRELLPSPELCELVEVAEKLAATPGVYAVKKQGECVCRWFSKKPEPTSDDALVDLVRKHPDATAEELWDLDHRSMGEFIKQLRAHPGICRTAVDTETPTYRLVEDAPTPDDLLLTLVRKHRGYNSTVLLRQYPHLAATPGMLHARLKALPGIFLSDIDGGWYPVESTP